MIGLDNSLGLFLVRKFQANGDAVVRMTCRERLDLFVAQDFAMLLEYFLRRLQSLADAKHNANEPLTLTSALVVPATNSRTSTVVPELAPRISKPDPGFPTAAPRPPAEPPPFLALASPIARTSRALSTATRVFVAPPDDGRLDEVNNLAPSTPPAMSFTSANLSCFHWTSVLRSGVGGRSYGSSISQWFCLKLKLRDTNIWTFSGTRDLAGRGTSVTVGGYTEALSEGETHGGGWRRKIERTALEDTYPIHRRLQDKIFRSHPITATL
jgi:hypothetical protein